MNPLSVRFLRASLLYLVLAVTVGLTFTLWPQIIWSHRVRHAHIALLGWVSMFIFGVAYHVVPRISTRTLYSERMGSLHFYLANIGTIGLAACFTVIPHRGWDTVWPFASLSAFLFALGAYLFVVNMWKSMGPDPGKPVIRFAGQGTKT
ncbi:MAG: cbb3-type cytochrome c oxidase subunit I [Nitrospirae bacterium]|nr:cbb3-type cytochrome c oxidase subunit I [Nitrospirota bacterium]